MKVITVAVLTFFLAGCDPSFEEGYQAQQKGNWQKAITIYTPLADDGDVRAQTELGNIYSHKEVNKPELAFKYFSLAAEQAQPWANTSLGMMYSKGESVKKDEELSLQKLEIAAKAGEPFAMYLLAASYGIVGNNLSDEQRNEKIRQYAYAAFERGYDLCAFDMARTYEFNSLEYQAWHLVGYKILSEKGQDKDGNYARYLKQYGADAHALSDQLASKYKTVEPSAPMPWRKDN
jgi:TPR repeat protein